MNIGDTTFSGFEIVNTVSDDMDVIFHLFESAIAYQEKNKYELWPVFERSFIQTEIDETRQWKIVKDGVIACIFSVLYNDPVIWGEERDREPSIYLHRIAINPVFKGRGMMRLIKDWAITYAKQTGKRYVRMDTWGNNKTLRDYYIRCGFIYLGQQQLIEKENVPQHYGGSLLSLFQIEV
jgi:GNAT superfamily N-acetyltransferase